MLDEEVKEGLEHFSGSEVGLVDLGIKVEVLVEVFSEFLVCRFEVGAVLDHGMGVAAGLVRRGDLVFLKVGFGGVKDFLDLAVNETADNEVTSGFRGQGAVGLVDPLAGFIPELQGLG